MATPIDRTVSKNSETLADVQEGQPREQNITQFGSMNTAPLLPPVDYDYYLVLVGKDNYYAGYYHGIAPVNAAGWTTMIVQQKLPHSAQHAVFRFRQGIGMFASPFGYVGESRSTGLTAITLGFGTDILAYTPVNGGIGYTFFGFIPHEAGASMPDGELTIRTSISSQGAVVTINPPGPPFQSEVLVVPTQSAAPELSTWRLRRARYTREDTPKSLSINLGYKATSVLLIVIEGQERAFAVGGDKACQLKPSPIGQGAPIQSIPAFSDGTEIALAACTLGLCTLNRQGAINLYPKAPATTNSTTISTPDQSFSAIAAWRTQSLLYAIDAGTNLVWQYDAAATSNRWTNVSSGLTASSVVVNSEGKVFVIAMGGPSVQRDAIYQLGLPSNLPGNLLIGTSALGASSLTVTDTLLIVLSKENTAQAWQGSTVRSWANLTTPQHRPWGGVLSVADGGTKGLLGLASDGLDIQAYHTKTALWETKAWLEAAEFARTLFGFSQLLKGYLFGAADGSLFWHQDMSSLISID